MPAPAQAPPLYLKVQAALAKVRVKELALRQTAVRARTMATAMATTVAQRAKEVGQQARDRAALAKAKELRALRHTAQWAMTMVASVATKIAHEAKAVRGHYKPRQVVLVGAATVLALGCWFAFKSHGSPATIESPTVTTQQPQHALQSTTPAAMSAKSANPSRLVSKPSPKLSPAVPRRVRVSDNEVDYVRGDVTVRHFTSKPSAQPKQVAKGRVVHVGDDVTVRHFAAEPGPPPAVTR